VPGPGERTDAHIPAEVEISELDLGTTPHLNGAAGVAVRILDDNTAMVAYQDGSNVVVRPIQTAPDPTRTFETPPSMTMLSLGVGETCTALDIGNGFYADSSGTGGVGRVIVGCAIEHGTMPHEIRVRAIEVCIGP
jgi:hypothetical protein